MNNFFRSLFASGDKAYLTVAVVAVAVASLATTYLQYNPISLGFNEDFAAMNDEGYCHTTYQVRASRCNADTRCMWTDSCHAKNGSFPSSPSNGSPTENYCHNTYQVRATRCNADPQCVWTDSCHAKTLNSSPGRGLDSTSAPQSTSWIELTVDNRAKAIYAAIGSSPYFQLRSQGTQDCTVTYGLGSSRITNSGTGSWRWYHQINSAEFTAGAKKPVVVTCSTSSGQTLRDSVMISVYNIGDSHLDPQGAIDSISPDGVITGWFVANPLYPIPGPEVIAFWIDGQWVNLANFKRTSRPDVNRTLDLSGDLGFTAKIADSKWYDGKQHKITHVQYFIAPDSDRGKIIEMQDYFFTLRAQ